jgi:hypothetical protein
MGRVKIRHEMTPGGDSPKPVDDKVSISQGILA